jgi:ADP-ribose pyrophosphatase
MPTGVDAEFDIATQPPSAGIVAITPEHRVILVPQFRPGPKTTLFELPGGFLDDDEDPYAAAQRELEEETGYRGDLQYAGRCYREAYSNAVKHCFVAFDAVPVAQRRVEDNEESVQAVLVDLPVFRDLLRRGKLTDVDLGYLALDAAGLLR